MDGILLIDKPAGITSAGVVAKVKRCLRAQKVGHTGTLDPMATGLLVCCMNKATRLTGVLESLIKIYQGVLWLGVRTDTQDATGKTIAETRDLSLAKNDIEHICTKFIGDRKQVPPMFSALKHQGVPLYKLARSGRGIVKPARPITIYSLEVLQIELPRVHFKVRCSKGTYIRTLAADIGDALGCGGHLAGLRRLACGQFRVEDAMKLDELTAMVERDSIGKRVITMYEALKGVPEVIVNNSMSTKIRCGKPLVKSDLNTCDQATLPWLKVVDSQKRLIALVSQDRKHERFRYHAVFPD
jgi:tRNA pseudouridine55 synthase